MDQYEVGEVVDCALCGCDVSLGRDRAYAMVESVLCISCAVCRGAVYDDARSTWIRPPSVSPTERALHTRRTQKRYWRVPTTRAETSASRARADQ